MSEGFFRTAKNGIILQVRLTPNARHDTIECVEDAADGNRRLKIKVRAVPEKGKANQALIVLIAKACGIAKSRISLSSGGKNRNKSLLIAGDPDEIIPLIEKLGSN